MLANCDLLTDMAIAGVDSQLRNAMFYCAISDLLGVWLLSRNRPIRWVIRDPQLTPCGTGKGVDSILTWRFLSPFSLPKVFPAFACGRSGGGARFVSPRGGDGREPG